MPKLRRAHQQQASKSFGMMVRIGILFLMVAGVFVGFRKWYLKFGGQPAEIVEKIPVVSNERFYLPTARGQVIDQKFYSISYSEPNEQAEWVAYELRRDSLNKPWVSRTDDWREDKKVRTSSARPEDYRGSGYDRGHLVPAGDMAFSEEAMSETFLLSNISPQVRGFNHGVWRELEELVRTWAKKFGHLYVVSGPVFEETQNKIGPNRVTVPGYYFKVLLDLTEPEVKSIGFVIPNKTCTETLDNFVVPVDSVEQLTGIDFFPVLLQDSREESLERRSDFSLWPVDPRKYRLRIEKWNKE
jgi:endonuclease G